MQLAPYADLTVLVLAAEQTEPGPVAALRDQIDAAGGRVAGLVLNRVQARAPRFLKRLVS
jgi:hypothetical protein